MQDIMVDLGKMAIHFMVNAEQRSLPTPHTYSKNQDLARIKSRQARMPVIDHPQRYRSYFIG